MDILYLLIPLSVVLAIVIGAAFWWAVDHGQFEDLEAPALRVLADDDRPDHPATQPRGPEASRRVDPYQTRSAAGRQTRT